MPVNPSTWGQRQEDWKFQDNLGYTVNVRPKWTAQGDSASEDKHNKLPGRKGPQVKTGSLRRPALPFFSFPVRGTVTVSTAESLFIFPFPGRAAMESIQTHWASTSRYFLICDVVFWIQHQENPAQHVVQTPQHFCSLLQHPPHGAITKGLF